MPARLRGLLRGDIGHGAASVGSSLIAMVAAFGTGILLARHLGPQGRGASAALLAFPTLVGWLFLFGSSSTVAYFRASRAGDAGALLGTWLALLVPLSVGAVIAAELLVPVIFDAQPAATRHLAAEFAVTIVVFLLSELAIGATLGDQRFFVYSGVRALTPLATATVFVILFAADDLSVRNAVWATAAAQLAATVCLLILAVRRDGLERPRRGLARELMWFGAKGHSTQVSIIVNARLDLVMMPAYLSATKVGLYSVATNISWIVYTLAAQIALVALPKAASRGGGEGVDVTLRSFRATLVFAGVFAIALMLLGSFAIEHVYGGAFGRAVPALRVLLPGAVAYSGALTLVSGLYAVNRPFTAGVAQFSGMAVTVVGLLLFLRSGGIMAAAWISTASYLVVLLASLIAYRSATAITWTTYLRRGAHGEPA